MRNHFLAVLADSIEKISRDTKSGDTTDIRSQGSSAQYRLDDWSNESTHEGSWGAMFSGLLYTLGYTYTGG